MAEHEIKIQNSAYVPADLEVQPGDTVTWTNLDSGMAHTATAAKGAAYDSLDTGDIAPNESASHAFDDAEAGAEIAYVCTHHSFMQGRLTVSAAAETTEHEVTIQNLAYAPAELQIKTGDTVTWTNRDAGMAHTATSRPGAAVAFDTGDLGHDETGSHTFAGVSAGDEIPYVCTHHGFMQGKITVT